MVQYSRWCLWCIAHKTKTPTACRLPSRLCRIYGTSLVDPVGDCGIEFIIHRRVCLFECASAVVQLGRNLWSNDRDYNKLQFPNIRERRTDANRRQLFPPKTPLEMQWPLTSLWLYWHACVTDVNISLLTVHTVLLVTPKWYNVIIFPFHCALPCTQVTTNQAD